MIKVVINNKGLPTFEVMDVKGPSCLDATAPIINRISAGPVDTEKKDDFYAAGDINANNLNWLQ